MIVQYDSPLRYMVQSERQYLDVPPFGSEPLFYLVDLEEPPRGKCGCIAFEMREPYIALGSPLVTCKHIRAARAHLLVRIMRGDFDEILTRDL